MHRKKIAVAFAAGATLLLGVEAALAGTMHPQLGAKLSGMGEHGIVNLQSHAAQGKLCWTFELTTKGITGASIRDAHGMKVAQLGMHYTAKGCDTVAKKALDLVEAKPAAYRIWVDTDGHPGELRGTLFAGMAHM
jgi:hypothetical protein